jgi:hypothetical protein
VPRAGLSSAAWIRWMTAAPPPGCQRPLRRSPMRTSPPLAQSLQKPAQRPAIAARGATMIMWHLPTGGTRLPVLTARLAGHRGCSFAAQKARCSRNKVNNGGTCSDLGARLPRRLPRHPQDPRQPQNAVVRLSRRQTGRPPGIPSLADPWPKWFSPNPDDLNASGFATLTINLYCIREKCEKP